MHFNVFNIRFLTRNKVTRKIVLEKRFFFFFIYLQWTHRRKYVFQFIYFDSFLTHRYKGDNVINYSQRGGISVVTEKQTRTSRLLISRALPADSGNYTCAPSTAESASVLVHVLNGE